MLTCPSCGARVPAANVNLACTTAKCAACGSAFELASLPRPPRRERRRPALPEGLTIEVGKPELPHDGDYRHAPYKQLAELVVKREWRERGQPSLEFFSMFFAVCGDVAIVVLCALIVLSGPMDSIRVSLLAVFSALGAVFTYFTYALLASRLNVTTLRVRDGVLSVRHGPLPWPGERTLPVSTVRQLFFRKRESRDEGRTVIVWELLAQIGEHATVALLAGVPRKEQVEYLEWVIEQHLGIVDDPMRNDG